MTFNPSPRAALPEDKLNEVHPLRTMHLLLENKAFRHENQRASFAVRLPVWNAILFTARRFRHVVARLKKREKETRSKRPFSSSTQSRTAVFPSRRSPRCSGLSGSRRRRPKFAGWSRGPSCRLQFFGVMRMRIRMLMFLRRCRKTFAFLCFINNIFFFRAHVLEEEIRKDQYCSAEN